MLLQTISINETFKFIENKKKMYVLEKEKAFIKDLLAFHQLYESPKFMSKKYLSNYYNVNYPHYI